MFRDLSSNFVFRIELIPGQERAENDEKLISEVTEPPSFNINSSNINKNHKNLEKK